MVTVYLLIAFGIYYPYNKGEFANSWDKVLVVSCISAFLDALTILVTMQLT